MQNLFLNMYKYLSLYEIISMKFLKSKSFFYEIFLWSDDRIGMINLLLNLSLSQGKQKSRLLICRDLRRYFFFWNILINTSRNYLLSFDFYLNFKNFTIKIFKQSLFLIKQVDCFYKIKISYAIRSFTIHTWL